MAFVKKESLDGQEAITGGDGGSFKVQLAPNETPKRAVTDKQQQEYPDYYSSRFLEGIDGRYAQSISNRKMYSNEVANLRNQAVLFACSSRSYMHAYWGALHSARRFMRQGDMTRPVGGGAFLSEWDAKFHGITPYLNHTDQAGGFYELDHIYDRSKADIYVNQDIVVDGDVLRMTVLSPTSVQVSYYRRYATEYQPSSINIFPFEYRPFGGSVTIDYSAGHYQQYHEFGGGAVRFYGMGFVESDDYYDILVMVRDLLNDREREKANAQQGREFKIKLYSYDSLVQGEQSNVPDFFNRWRDDVVNDVRFSDIKRQSKTALWNDPFWIEKYWVKSDLYENPFKEKFIEEEGYPDTESIEKGTIKDESQMAEDLFKNTIRTRDVKISLHKGGSPPPITSATYISVPQTEVSPDVWED